MPKTIAAPRLPAATGDDAEPSLGYRRPHGHRRERRTFGHGPGPALHERPIISRLVALDHPMEIRTGMVLALETYRPPSDGFSAAHIEEEVVATGKGCEVITRFPAEDLPIANAY
jgi:Xaa-Pro aminopeptidase